MRTPMPPTQRRAAPEAVLRAANEYIVARYPFGLLAGPPCVMALGRRKVWIVPVLLTSPGYGPVGDVGVVALDARSRRIVGSTPRSQVAASMRRLKEGRRDELQAAFLRARTV